MTVVTVRVSVVDLALHDPAQPVPTAPAAAVGAFLRLCPLAAAAPDHLVTAERYRLRAGPRLRRSAVLRR